MLSLRDFQLKCVNTLDPMESACLVSATGSGKTMMGAALSWREVSRGGRIAFVVPRDNLARQTAGTLRKWGLTSGFILGGEKENRAAKVQIISYQSLGSKKRSLDWVQEQSSLWLVDECHITAFAQSLSPCLAHAKRKIGVTATPWQMGGKRSLLDIFDEPVFAPPPAELIKRGFLAQPIYFRPKRKGKKLDAPPEFIYEKWDLYAPGEKTFIFCGSIAESDATAEYFRLQGIAAVSVTSKTPNGQVEPIFDAFKEGEVIVLVSCNKLAEGCDIPDATCVVLANRTESMSGAIQRIGRGARVAPGKTHFKIIDCVGITKKFGRFEDIEVTRADFALDEPKEGSFPEKQCEHCDAWNHLSRRFCEKCGEEFDFEATQYDHPGELERLTSNDTEARAIAAFHSMLLRDFKHGIETCEKEFFSQYGYYPADHWVVDCHLPDVMKSGAVNLAWKSFKKRVSDRLPKGHVQLILPGMNL